MGGNNDLHEGNKVPKGGDTIDVFSIEDNKPGLMMDTSSPSGGGSGSPDKNPTKLDKGKGRATDSDNLSEDRENIFKTSALPVESDNVSKKPASPVESDNVSKKPASPVESEKPDFPRITDRVDMAYEALYNAEQALQIAREAVGDAKDTASEIEAGKILSEAELVHKTCLFEAKT